MKTFYSLTVFFLIIVVINCIVDAQFESKSIQGKPAQEKLVKKLEAENPDIIFLGNSLIGSGLEVDFFQKATSSKTSLINIGGSASAVWYLVLKNSILTLQNKPKKLILVSRDYFLTMPTYRATGRYVKFLDDYSSADEPFLERKLYSNHLSEIFFNTSRLIALIKYRRAIKDEVDLRVKKYFSSLSSESFNKTFQIDRAIERLFHEDNMNTRLLSAAQHAAEKVSDAKEYDFEEKVNVSFLPEIIRLCREAGIQLVIVRYKVERDSISLRNNPELNSYIQQLSEYLAANDVQFIDFSTEPLLTSSLYIRGDHYNKVGKYVFTALLVDKFRELGLV